MAKQTMQLFLKAFVIGLLLQVGLGQVPEKAHPINHNHSISTPATIQAPANNASSFDVSVSQ